MKRNNFRFPKYMRIWCNVTLNMNMLVWSEFAVIHLQEWNTFYNYILLSFLRFQSNKIDVQYYIYHTSQLQCIQEKMVTITICEVIKGSFQVTILWGVPIIIHKINKGVDLLFNIYTRTINLTDCEHTDNWTIQRYSSCSTAWMAICNN